MGQVLINPVIAEMWGDGEGSVSGAGSLGMIVRRLRAEALCLSCRNCFRTLFTTSG